MGFAMFKNNELKKNRYIEYDDWKTADRFALTQKRGKTGQL